MILIVDYTLCLTSKFCLFLTELILTYDKLKAGKLLRSPIFIFGLVIGSQTRSSTSSKVSEGLAYTVHSILFEKRSLNTVHIHEKHCDSTLLAEGASTGTNDFSLLETD